MVLNLRQINLTLCATVFATALIGSAQRPVPAESPKCGGVRGAQPNQTKVALPVPTARAFAVGAAGLCSEYAVMGWETTMHLYLGEGAEDWVSYVQTAAALWNESLVGFNQRPVIEVVSERKPLNPSLHPDFWLDPGEHGKDNINDGQSVVYFKPSVDNRDVFSFAWTRWNGSGRMVEADIYINTHYENHYGGVLYDTTSILPLGTDHAAYALVDSTYLTILHEIGHALGLNHVPIAGNIMSYNYLPRMVDIWRAPISMAAANEIRQSPGFNAAWDQFPFAQRIENVSPYMYTDLSEEDVVSLINLYTDSVSLGEQDRMALMCVYDFSDWNH